MVALKEVQEAYERIRGVANHTPIMTSSTIDYNGYHVFFKCENFQKGGAFKFRGAYNTISQLTDDEKRRGVITHSSGNHAQAVALACSLLGIKATIVMPENSPRVKVEATRGYGAEIVFCQNSVESRARVAGELMNEHGYTLVHPYNDERIVAGAGTAALELIQDAPPLNTLCVPVGGGGLLSGMAVATKGLSPDTRVIGVEPKNADDAQRSFREGHIFPSVRPDTIADGLKTQLGDITFPIIRRLVDDIITVTEEEIVGAMRHLWERMKIVVEPSGAVPLAGVLKMSDSLQEQNVGVILSGGNVDLDLFFDHLRRPHAG
ncbi:MAG: threonine/serine dehydratase [Candidatus Thorarchaeota archaeon]|nr:MAG: threonine/serine dehydratase [Candidatus Thorarchaeota archaeon]